MSSETNQERRKYKCQVGQIKKEYEKTILE